MFSATKSFFTNEATGGGGGPTPSWSLDFSSGTPSGYTLTRASTGTYVDSSGYVASASTDVARLTHNSSGSRLGLLVEGQRTNFAGSTETLATNIAINVGGTITNNHATGPDNTTSADRLELTATGYIYKSTAVTNCAGSSYVASVWVKGTAAAQTVRFRFAGGSSNPTGLIQTSTITTSTTDWTRVVLPVSTWTGTAQRLDFGIDQRSAVGSGPGTSCDVLLWGWSIEEVPSATAGTTVSATSYIPNTSTTATATRSADLVHVLDSAITSWGDPGALVIHFYAPGQAGTLISTDDASTAQVGIEASTTTAARAFWSSGSTATGTIGSGVQKAVHDWNGSTSKFAINGGTVQSGTNNFTIANADFVTLGAEATESGGVPGTFSQYSNVIIRKVEFYSGTLSDSDLQTITT